MRTIIVLMCIMATVGTALAQSLDTSRETPSKPTTTRPYIPPEESRQGGENINDAFPISGLPFADSGTTVGYINDYDESCPYSASVSPDVVYSFTPSQDSVISVDLCGSGYDTKTYIYDEYLNTVICNDDFYFDDECGVLISNKKYENLAGGQLYYIVVDGYGGDAGPYELMIDEFHICHLECYPDAVDEGEPELHDGYVDMFNGGCNSEEFGAPFQEVNWTNDADGDPPYDGQAWLCGTSGWFYNQEGTQSRDTDWFRVFALQDGVMEFTAESDFACYMFKLAPLDCGSVGVELQATCNFAEQATLTFPVTAGEEVWLWVGPTVFSGPVTEFTYFMTVTNNQFDVVPAEDVSWGGVKALFR